MRHYLGNTGQEYEVDVNEMLDEIPNFSALTDETLRQLVNKVLKEDDINQTADTIISSDWKPIFPDDENWFYAMNGFYYSVSANVKVTPLDSDEDLAVKTVYKIFVSDYYTWDTGKSTSFLKDGLFENVHLPNFVNTPYEGKIIELEDSIVVYDTALQELHKAGLAQEFHIVGETEKLILEYRYDPSTRDLTPVVPGN
jgi:hypothetical protein